MIALFVLPLLAMLSRAFAHGSPQEVADKWERNLSQAQADMTAGVDRVSVSPGERAAASIDRWRRSLADPVTQKKWEDNVRRGGALEPWKQSMKAIGISRAVQGATAKKQKMVSAMDHLLPFIDNARSMVDRMPNATYADREQRMLAWGRQMRTYRRTHA